LWLFSAILLIKKPHFWRFYFLEKEKKTCLLRKNYLWHKKEKKRKEKKRKILSSQVGR
jgi:hypothetical protein